MNPDASRYNNIVITSTMNQGGSLLADQDHYVKHKINKLFSSVAGAFGHHGKVDSNSCIVADAHKDVYLEFPYSNKAEFFEVNWTVKNLSEDDYPHGSIISAVWSFPSVMTKQASKICELKRKSIGNLKIRIDLPKDFKHDYICLMFKLQTQEGQFFGPNFLLIVRIVRQQSANQ